MSRLAVEEEEGRWRSRVEELGTKVEEVQAELATAREELVLKGREVEEVRRCKEVAERRLEKREGEERRKEEEREGQSSLAASLRGEVLLLQQDNRCAAQTLRISF